jgi:hypothetical protein
MRSVYRNLGRGAAVLMGLAVATAAHGQPTRPGVHRMEINNGAQQTVRYFPNRLSPGEGVALRDLERSENELSFVRKLQDLKREYVADEARLQVGRNLAAQRAYDVFATTPTSYGAFGGPGGYGVLAAINTGFPFAFELGSGLGFGYGGYYGLGYGLGGYYGVGAGRGFTGLVGDAASLAFGPGWGVDPGPIKDNMAVVIAKQATPEYAASIERNYDTALVRASHSPSLRVALDLPKPRADGVPVGFEDEPSAPVVLTLKDGRRLAGQKVEETKDWVILTTKTRKIRIRPSEVTSIDEGKSGVIGG